MAKFLAVLPLEAVRFARVNTHTVMLQVPVPEPACLPTALVECPRSPRVLDRFVQWIDTNREAVREETSRAPSLVGRKRAPGKEVASNEPFARLKEAFRTTQSLIAPVYRSNTPSPFAKLSAQTKAPPSTLSYLVNPRLNVTRMVPQFCEVRTAFELFGDTERKPNAAMASGTRSHALLEASTHPELPGIADVLQTIPPTPSKATLNQHAMEVAQTLFRLQTMWMDGEAREVNVYGFLDQVQGEWMEGDSPQAVLVGGVIDCLRLERPLEKAISLPRYNLEEFFAALARAGGLSGTLTITDVKTRRNAYAPIDPVQAEAARYQVFYYRRMLEVLSTLAYEILIKIAQRKGIDVDEPVDDRTMMALCLNHPGLHFERTSDDSGAPPHPPALASALAALPVQVYDTFTTKDMYRPWSLSFTVRQLTARLAQMFMTLGLVLDEQTQCLVEYYVNDEPFRTVRYSYKEEVLFHQTQNALDFWFARRPPQGVSPERANVCSWCDFKAVCAASPPRTNHLLMEA